MKRILLETQLQGVRSVLGSLTTAERIALQILDTYAPINSAEGTDPYITIGTWQYLLTGSLKCTLEELEKVAESLEQKGLIVWLPSHYYQEDKPYTHLTRNKVWASSEQTHKMLEKR